MLPGTCLIKPVITSELRMQPSPTSYKERAALMEVLSFWGYNNFDNDNFTLKTVLQKTVFFPPAETLKNMPNSARKGWSKLSCCSLTYIKVYWLAYTFAKYIQIVTVNYGALLPTKKHILYFLNMLCN